MRENLAARRKLAIQVIPPPIFAHKAADFVQPVGAPADFAARNKFYRGAIFRFREVFFNFEAEPFCGICREVERGGTGVPPR